MTRLVRLLLSVGLGAALVATTGAAEETAVTAAATTVVSATYSSATTAATVSTTSASKLPKRCRVKGRVLCADKTKRKLYYVVNGLTVRTLDARFGCAGARHTRQGTFKVRRKSRHHVSTIYHTPIPWSMFFSGGQAVHYSADFARRGYKGCSHGCVNVRNAKKIAYIYSRIRVGDRVVVYRS